MSNRAHSARSGAAGDGVACDSTAGDGVACEGVRIGRAGSGSDGSSGEGSNGDGSSGDGSSGEGSNGDGSSGDGSVSEGSNGDGSSGDGSSGEGSNGDGSSGDGSSGEGSVSEGSNGDGSGFGSAEFRRVLGHYPTGVTVVTAACGDEPVGLSIGSFSSVSLEPPLVLFCLARKSYTGVRLRSAGSFCVNVLADDQVELCSVFSNWSEDRFRGVPFRSEATGAPVIDGCLAWIDCRLHAVHRVGDHDVIIGEVVALSTGTSEPGSSVAGAESAHAPATSDSAALQSAVTDSDTTTRGPLVFLRGGYGRVESLDV